MNSQLESHIPIHLLKIVRSTEIWHSTEQYKRQSVINKIFASKAWAICVQCTTLLSYITQWNSYLICTLYINNLWMGVYKKIRLWAVVRNGYEKFASKKIPDLKGIQIYDFAQQYQAGALTTEQWSHSWWTSSNIWSYSIHPHSHFQYRHRFIATHNPQVCLHSPVARASTPALPRSWLWILWRPEIFFKQIFPTV